MESRQRTERWKHRLFGESIEDCHCQHLGTLRKHKPFEWGSNHTNVRRYYWFEKKEPKWRRKKQRRRDSRREIQEILS